MASRLMKSPGWVSLILLSILIKWASWYPGWVERNYSLGLYPWLARVQRFLFGWIPFSLGDLLYALLILLILYKTFQLCRILVRRKMSRAYFTRGLQQVIFFFLLLYVSFNLLWGLNYDRRGIAYQLNLDVKPYSLEDLDTLTQALMNRVNHYASSVTEAQRDSFNRKKILFEGATSAYAALAKQYPFLAYRPPSLKPTLYSYAGNYLGFQGYYNPFTGEGQVNTTVPRFLEPFVATHEIAHQLGYARENEANFVGYLACRYYEEPAFRYSAYYDMYNYAVSEVFRRDTALGRRFQDSVHGQVRRDQEAFTAFYKKYRNPVEPIVMWGYGQFLKANRQPAGKRSYNQVVAWLVAYYKRYGVGAL